MHAEFVDTRRKDIFDLAHPASEARKQGIEAAVRVVTTPNGVGHCVDVTCDPMHPAKPNGTLG